MAYHWRSTLDAYDRARHDPLPDGQHDCTTTGARYCLDDVHATIEPDDRRRARLRRRALRHADRHQGRRDPLRADRRGQRLLISADFTWEDLERGSTDDRFQALLVRHRRSRPVPLHRHAGAGDDHAVRRRRGRRQPALPGDARLPRRDHRTPSRRNLDPQGDRHPQQFFLTPRTDGSSIAFAPSPYAVLRFTPANPSGVAGYDWCGTNTTDLAAAARLLRRRSEPVGHRGHGDRPRHALRRRRPAAADHHRHAALQGGVRLDDVGRRRRRRAPQLPSCDGPNPPVADFKVVNPAPIEEGEAVQFVDRSEDVDGDARPVGVGLRRRRRQRRAGPDVRRRLPRRGHLPGAA